MATRSKLAVLLHADVVESTRLVQRDERIAHERIRDAFRVFAETIERYEGIPQEIRGDALVAEFERASDAVSAALAFQVHNEECNASIADGIRPRVRIGIALGEVIVADRTVTGAGVVLAQRLEQLAEPGALCISAAVREALPGRMPFAYAPLGEQTVKGFDDAVHVFSVDLVPGAGVPDPEPAAATPEPRRAWSSARWLAVPAALVLAALVGWLVPTMFGDNGGAGDAAISDDAGSGEDLSIVVLPFRNRSDDETQDYFSDGVSEDIATDLTEIERLSVVPTTTARRYRDGATDLRRVSGELGVRYVLEGSVRRNADRIRVSAQLYDAKSNQQVWAERYDRSVDDLFAVQDDIAENVVVSLSAKLSKDALTRVARAYTPKVEAYDLYIRGRATRIPPTPDNLARASALFDEAIAADPKFAGGYAGASFTSILRYGACTEACEKHLEVALSMAREAVKIDPTFGPGFGSLAEALFRSGDFEAAESASRTATELAPNDSLMRASYGRILGHVERPEEGIEHVKQALRMSPDSLPLLFYLGSIYRVAGRYEEAIDALIEHRKRLGGRILPSPAAQLAAAYFQAGREAEARAIVEELLRVSPRFTVAQESRTIRFASTEDAVRYREVLLAAGLPEG